MTGEETSNHGTASGYDELPLDGITVVSLEQAVAAPLATRHLADLGARVVKVERVGDGDFARDYDSAVLGLAAHFVWLNRGKESFAVDLKAPAGVDAVKSLIAGADVFLQNLAPGAVDRLGLGADELRADHPELIVVNMSGYGTDGPMRDRKAYDLLVQSESGLCSITGTPETAVKTGIPTSDIAAGMYALTSIQAALLRRYRTGMGATIDVSMFDATAEWLGYPMYLQMYQDRQVPRMGLAHTSIAPYDKYPTATGRSSSVCRTTAVGGPWPRCWGCPSWRTIRVMQPMWNGSRGGRRSTNSSVTRPARTSARTSTTSSPRPASPQRACVICRG